MKLFTNATFHTMRQPGECECAMLTKNGIIKELFCGNIPQMQNAQIIDLDGASVYPGFIDTHTHSFAGGLYLLCTDLINTKSISELIEKIKATPPLANMHIAWQLDETNLLEKRFPTKAELDKAFPHIPVLIRRVDGHSCVVNTHAQRTMELCTSSVLTGTDNDFAVHKFHGRIDKEGIISAYMAAEKLALSRGHTSIHTMIGDAAEDPRHYAFLDAHRSAFTLDWVLYPQVCSVEKALELGADRVGGCVLADGSFGSHTAGLTSSYADADTKGCLYQSDNFWENYVVAAHLAGIPACVHAIGDAAVEQVLKAIEKAQKMKEKDIKHQIIHAELLSDTQIERMAASHAVAVMQPMFDKLWNNPGGLYPQVLGVERSQKTNRLRDMFRKKVLVTGSSDWYITALDALQGFAAAKNMHNPQQSLTPFQAMSLYTSNAGKISGNLKIGMLAPDYQADFVCLNKELFVCDLVARKTPAKVTKTYKKGILCNC